MLVGLGSSAPVTPSTFVGGWHHIARTYSVATTTQRVYLNGVALTPVGTASSTSTFNAASPALWLGRRPSYGSAKDATDLQIDEVRMWRRVLTDVRSSGIFVDVFTSSSIETCAFFSNSLRLRSPLKPIQTALLLLPLVSPRGSISTMTRRAALWQTT